MKNIWKITLQIYIFDQEKNMAMNIPNVREFSSGLQRFQDDRDDVENNASSGRPSMSKTCKNMGDLIQSDLRLPIPTITETAKSYSFFIRTAHQLTLQCLAKTF